jgi:hypothetical protein
MTLMQNLPFGWERDHARLLTDVLEMPDDLQCRRSGDWLVAFDPERTVMVTTNNLATFRLLRRDSSGQRDHRFQMSGPDAHPMKGGIRYLAGLLHYAVSAGLSTVSTVNFKNILRMCAARYVPAAEEDDAQHILAVSLIAAVAGWSGTTRLYYGEQFSLCHEDDEEIVFSDLPAPLDVLRPALSLLMKDGSLYDIREPFVEATSSDSIIEVMKVMQKLGDLGISCAAIEALEEVGNSLTV